MITSFSFESCILSIKTKSINLNKLRNEAESLRGELCQQKNLVNQMVAELKRVRQEVSSTSARATKFEIMYDLELVKSKNGKEQLDGKVKEVKRLKNVLYREPRL